MSGLGASQGIRWSIWRSMRGLAKWLRWLILGDRVPETIGWQLGQRLDGDVVVYFADTPSRLYQLTQWIPVLEQLHRTRHVILVLRRISTYNIVGELTWLPRVYVPLFFQLTDLYTSNQFKVALYVNNSARNFQSLIYQSTRHVHINHGESDKVSMVSNQAKAYDEVFIAGEAARRRHRAALLDLDESKLVPVGRPQLDLHVPSAIARTSRRSVLYAPTWEGESEGNNYTSVDILGAAIVKAALAVPDVRFVYKPHPRIPESIDRGMIDGHKEILALIEEANQRDPEAAHVVALEEDFLGLIEESDLLIADVSSVTLDFLYLATERPIFVTDRYGDRGRLLIESPVAKASDVIDVTSIDRLAKDLENRLDHDDLLEQRNQMRAFYFGDMRRGESTARFIAAVSEAAARRDAMVAARKKVRARMAAEDVPFSPRSDEPQAEG